MIHDAQIEALMRKMITFGKRVLKQDDARTVREDDLSVIGPPRVRRVLVTVSVGTAVRVEIAGRDVGWRNTETMLSFSLNATHASFASNRRFARGSIRSRVYARSDRTSRLHVLLHAR